MGEIMHGTQAFYKFPLQITTSTYCPKCKLEMRLAYLVPEQPGFDLRTFECTNCGLEETSLRSISFPEWRQPRARSAASSRTESRKAASSRGASRRAARISRRIIRHD